MKDEELIHELTEDIMWAHHEFDFYKKLFHNSPEVNELLKNTAHNFFIHLEGILADRCIINISRLTDPFEQKGFKNLSLQLLKEIGEKNNWEYLPEIKHSLDIIDKMVVQVRKHRNKLKVHKDLETIRDPTNLDIITIHDLEKIFDEIGKLMNIYYINEGELPWDFYPECPGGVESLLAYLDVGFVEGQKQE